jgi:hypothetical protein
VSDYTKISAASLANKLEASSRRDSKLVDEMIEAGRGRELPTETRLKTDSLSKRFNSERDTWRELQAEKERRMAYHGSMRPIKRKENPSMREVDPHAVRELILFAENEYKLRNQWDSIIANLAKKRAKGLYDKTLAAKLWRYWADSAAKEYTKQFDTGKGFGVFNVPTRNAAAVEMEMMYRENINEKPTPRDGGRTAYIRRRSQITKKAPVKRLKKRRAKNWDRPTKGRFPNPLFKATKPAKAIRVRERKALTDEFRRLREKLEATPFNVDASAIIERMGELNVLISDIDRRIPAKKERAANPAPRGFVIYAQGTGKRMNFDGTKFSERAPKIYGNMRAAEGAAMNMLAKFAVLKKYKVWVAPESARPKR